MGEIRIFLLTLQKTWVRLHLRKQKRDGLIAQSIPTH